MDDFYLRTRVRGDGNSRFFLRVGVVTLCEELRNHNVITESMYQNPDNLESLGNKSSEVGSSGLDEL